MKKILFLLTLSLLSFTSISGQNIDWDKAKIKVKKGKVLVNDSIWAICDVKGSFFKGYQYHFQTIDGKPLVTMYKSSAESLLKDSTYIYTKIIFYFQGKQYISSIEDIELTAMNNIDKKVAVFLIKQYQVLGKNALVEDKYNNFIKEFSDSIPKRITGLLSYQKSLMIDVGFIAKRNTSVPVTVSPSSNTCNRHESYNYKTYCLDIYQDGQYIGYAKYDVEKVSADDPFAKGKIYIILYNSKGSIVGSYSDSGVGMDNKPNFPVIYSAKTGTQNNNVYGISRNNSNSLVSSFANYFISRSEL